MATRAQRREPPLPPPPSPPTPCTWTWPGCCPKRRWRRLRSGSRAPTLPSPSKSCNGRALLSRRRSDRVGRLSRSLLMQPASSFTSTPLLHAVRSPLPPSALAALTQARAVRSRPAAAARGAHVARGALAVPLRCGLLPLPGAAGGETIWARAKRSRADLPSSSPPWKATPFLALGCYIYVACARRTQSRRRPRTRCLSPASPTCPRPTSRCSLSRATTRRAGLAAARCCRRAAARRRPRRSSTSTMRRWEPLSHASS